MKKIIAAMGFLFAIGVCFAGCTQPKQFAISLKAGLFQGSSELDPELTISAEFSEMDRAEYVKTNENKVKDLSTIDTKFYTAYHLELVFSEGNENYVMTFSQAAAQTLITTDTYALRNLTGDRFDRKSDLSDVALQLVDHDGDRTADELRLDYTRNGASDSAVLKFVAAGTEGPIPHHHFQYQCNLTFDENIRFKAKADDAFWAATSLNYSVYAIEGYRVVMDVNGEPYTEIDPSGLDVLRFEYITGYRDVDIRFRAVEIRE